LVQGPPHEKGKQVVLDLDAFVEDYDGDGDGDGDDNHNRYGAENATEYHPIPLNHQYPSPDFKYNPITRYQGLTPELVPKRDFEMVWHLKRHLCGY
jgi:hypothetical protein